jgi:hypothetical protein
LSLKQVIPQYKFLFFMQPCKLPPASDPSALLRDSAAIDLKTELPTSHVISMKWPSQAQAVHTGLEFSNAYFQAGVLKQASTFLRCMR